MAAYLTQLKTLVEVYRYRNITKAAKQLGLSQSAVTAHIQALESFIGKPLFTRKPRGVEATALAHDLIAQISLHFDEIEQRLSAFRSRNQPIFGTLNLSGPAEYLNFMAKSQLSHLLKQSDINLIIQIGNKDQIYNELLNGTTDLAITASLPNPNLYDYQIIDSETLLLVMDAESAQPYQSRQPTYEQLCEHRVLAYDHDRPLIRQYFAHAFNQPCHSPIAVVAPDLRILASLAATGVGYTVLPSYLCRSQLHTGELKQVGATGPENYLYLVWKKGALKQARIAYTKAMLMTNSTFNQLNLTQNETS